MGRRAWYAFAYDPVVCQHHGIGDVTTGTFYFLGSNWSIERWIHQWQQQYRNFPVDTGRQECWYNLIWSHSAAYLFLASNSVAGKWTSRKRWKHRKQKWKTEMETRKWKHGNRNMERKNHASYSTASRTSIVFYFVHSWLGCYMLGRGETKFCSCTMHLYSQFPLRVL